MQGTLVLTNHLWGDVLSFLIEFVSLLALAIAVNFNFVVPESIFENLVAQVREIVQNIVEFHDWVLGEEPTDVCCGSGLLELLKIARLRVTDFKLGLQLSDRVRTVHLSDHYPLLIRLFTLD